MVGRRVANGAGFVVVVNEPDRGIAPVMGVFGTLGKASTRKHRQHVSRRPCYYPTPSPLGCTFRRWGGQPTVRETIGPRTCLGWMLSPRWPSYLLRRARVGSAAASQACRHKPYTRVHVGSRHTQPSQLQGYRVRQASLVPGANVRKYTYSSSFMRRPVSFAITD